MDNDNILNEFKKTIRDVADFPKPGIVFKDITPVLGNPELCRKLLKILVSKWQKVPLDAIVGIESRGFLFGLPLAMQLGIPFIPVRKQGKLPARTFAASYELEYGFATLEMHEDALEGLNHVLVHDDLLATGGTAEAARELVEQGGGTVQGYSFLIELNFLKGRERLASSDKVVDALLSY